MLGKLSGKEYYHLGLFAGEILWTLRVSIGDNSLIGESSKLAPAENYLFWFCWFVSVMVSCVVFLNFIVAEASNTYAVVTDTLEATIWMEKSNLIGEAEEMTWEIYKS